MSHNQREIFMKHVLHAFQCTSTGNTKTQELTFIILTRGFRETFFDHTGQNNVRQFRFNEYFVSK